MSLGSARVIPARARAMFAALLYSVRSGGGLRLGSGVMLSRGTLRVGSNVKVGTHSELTGPVALGDEVYLAHHVVLSASGGSIEVGDRSTFNPFTTVYGHGGVQIGSRVSVATKVTIVAYNKRFDDPEAPIKGQGQSAQGIRIDDDAWIGAGATILDGVHIGEGAVVGAGAVVTHDVDAGAVVAGVPARPIATRGHEGADVS